MGGNVPVFLPASVFVPLEERTSTLICEESISYLGRRSTAGPRQRTAWTVVFSSSPTRLPLEPAERRAAAEPGPPHLLSYVSVHVLLTRLYSVFEFLQNMFLFNPLSDPLRVICTVVFSGGLEPIHATQSSIQGLD